MDSFNEQTPGSENPPLPNPNRNINLQVDEVSHRVDELGEMVKEVH
ncbi:hypothetical protein LINPERHAP1_LOCUS1086, partial [Linum perenne]